MNNIQKQLKAKQGLRAAMPGPQLAGMAEGGFVEPSIGGFIKDRMQAAKELLTPKVVSTLRDRTAQLEQQSNPMPAPAPTPAQTPEKPAEPFRFSRGGPVCGPGTGTSDSVPAMLSKGEYVLPADTVRHVGKGNLDGLRAATHTPVHMLNGGSVWDAVKNKMSGSMPSTGTAAVATPVSMPPLDGRPPISNGLPPAPVATPVGDPATLRSQSAATRAATQEALSMRGAPPAGSAPPNYPPPVRSAVVEPAAAKGLVATTKAGLGLGLRAVGGLTGLYEAGSAARDMGDNGPNTSNSIDLTSGLATGAGSLMTGAAAAPLVVGGLAAGAGKYVGDTINNNSPRLGDALVNPGDVAKRWWNHGPTLRPEALSGHVGGDTYTPGRSLDSYKVDSSTSSSSVPDQSEAETQRLSNIKPAFQPTQYEGGITGTRVEPRAPTAVDTAMGESKGVPVDAANRYITMRNGANSFSGSGSPVDPNAPTQDQLVANKIAAMNRTADLERQVNGLRAAEANANDPNPGVRTIGEGMTTREQDLAAKSGSGRLVSGATAAHHAKMAEIAQAGRTAQMQNATTLRSQNMQYGSSMYGHDVQHENNVNTVNASLRGHEATNNLARAQMQIAQQNHRDLLNQQGVENTRAQTDQDFKEREAAAKSTEDRLGTIFTAPDVNGKMGPDAARVGAASKAINDEIGSRITQLKAIPKNDPRYDQAQKMADTLTKKGHAALGPDDMQRLISQAAIKDRVSAVKSVLPGGSSPVDSGLGGYEVDPKTPSDPHLIGSDTITLKNGTKVRANDLRFTDPGNPFFNGFKVPTTQFDAGLRGGK